MAVNFSRSMVGGDIGGLAALASKLQQVAPQMQPVVDALDSRVEKLVHDAGWWGDAASKFKATWEQDSLKAQILMDVINFVASIAGTLSEQLRIIERDLEQVAGEARAAGVPVAETGEMLDLPDAADPVLVQAAVKYQETRAYLMQLADDARTQATGRLMEVEKITGPPKEIPGSSLPPDTALSMTDFVATLYALPAGAQSMLRDERANASAKADVAKAAWRKALHRSHSNHTKVPADVKAEHLKTARALKDIDRSISRFKPWTNRLMRLLDTRVGNLAPAIKGAKVLRAAGDIPILDVVVGVASTAALSYDDAQKGDDWGTAVAKEAAGQVVVLGAAAVVAGGIIAVGGSGVLVVAGAVIAGAAVAVGVGDFVDHAIHEHWDEDINKYGVAGGIGHGLQHSGEEVLQDANHLLSPVGQVKDNIVHAVQNVNWGGIFNFGH